MTEIEEWTQHQKKMGDLYAIRRTAHQYLKLSHLARWAGCTAVNIDSEPFEAFLCNVIRELKGEISVRNAEFEKKADEVRK